jgi:hypothetical protein
MKINNLFFRYNLCSSTENWDCFHFSNNTFGGKRIHTRIRKKTMVVLVRRLSLYFLFVTSPRYWLLIIKDIFQKPTPSDHIICHIRLCCPTLKYHHLSPRKWITSSPIVVLRSWWSPMMPNFLMPKLPLYYKYVQGPNVLLFAFPTCQIMSFSVLKFWFSIPGFFQPMH